MTDKKGFLIENGMEVNVPNPNETDIHNNSFVGTVVDILEDRNTVIVQDQDDNFFEIESDRLTINE